jgi:hypothetical protein
MNHPGAVFLGDFDPKEAIKVSWTIKFKYAYRSDGQQIAFSYRTQKKNKGERDNNHDGGTRCVIEE